MQDIKVIRKCIISQSKPPCETVEYYSVNGGKSWMTYSQYFNWSEAFVAKVWKNYSAHDIRKQVEACLVA